MFERFTERARRVVVLAQEESRLLNHNYIGTEHLLLGLLHEGEGVAAKALEELGISLDAVRQRVEDMIGQGSSAPIEGHIPFTPRAKKVLELALREGLQLGHNYIGTEHILLGLVREGEGVAAQVLVQMGADLDRVRHATIQLLSGYGGKSPESGGAYATEALRVEPLGRRLRLRVMGGRITISIDDPANADLPELDLVVRNPDLMPDDSRAIYQTVRNLVRQLDQRLADLEPHIAFDDPLPPPAAAAEPPE